MFFGTLDRQNQMKHNLKGPFRPVDGHLLRYIEGAIGEEKVALPNKTAQPIPISRNKRASQYGNSVSKDDVLYKRTSDGNYVPVASLPLKSSSLPTLHKRDPSDSVNIDTGEWDGWPNGNFKRDFTPAEIQATGNLRVHWAVRVNGGDRKGNEHAENWEGGKKSSRRCLGVIECDNPLCKTLIRPHTAPEGINKQLTEPCKCGAELSHRRCNIISYLWRWSDGIHYENGGFHTHRRPTHILHLWLESGKKPLQTTLVPYSGALSIVERAQIANWFLSHISKNAETWLGRLPLAHAFTLYTAEHIKNEPKLKVLTQPEIINEAWRIQFTGIPSVLFDIDVEREALENLETEMFEVSRDAGIASYHQWGLDAGHHQDWDPYGGMEDLNHQDCPGDDDDLQVGPDYIHREEIIQPTEKKSRPKPRPKMIKKTE
ncbi:hypothetical protein K443DRAFT_7219 [Laccaria amethystina LaAM-08-1]|uniref:Uncharacterized protein n=1 Tax=Laccaria amethystina LaAM-08-1 TaxID=1095629 RepID=A0A0C9X7Q5_9AGAR|nr:hypothetical protein K443DRAFT_7219 [Laccaria amethystina LaAM-08-1]